MIPQNVVPSPNHCTPEAAAKKMAGVFLMTPATPPVMTPAVPRWQVSILTYQSQ